MAAIVGTSGNDTLVGTAEDDSLNGRAGADSMSGGAGNDTYYVDNPADSIVEAADGGDDKVYVTGSFALANNQHVETLRAQTDAATSITGNNLANRIYGRAAADTLNGSFGDDTINGVGGDDTIRGGWGLDTLYGDVGADTLYGDDNNDSVYGGEGDDFIYGGTGSDFLDGGLGADLLVGGTGYDTYKVDSIGDLVVEDLDSGLDAVSASLDYTLTPNVENLTLTGSARAGTGNALGNTIIGTSGHDTLLGLGGNDVLTGGLGDDYLNGGQGNDKLNGGAGNDTYFITGGTDTVEDGSGNDRIILDWSVSEFSIGNQAIETLELVGGHDGGSFYAGTKVGTTMIGKSGSEYLYGNIMNDVLIGGGGGDYLYGGKGNDILDGRGGVAQMGGGQGNDTYYVSYGSDEVLEYANEGTDTVRSSVTTMLSANVEILVLEGTANVNGFGDDGTQQRDTLIGNSGNNILDGLYGNDILTGGAGADTFRISDVIDSDIDTFTDVAFGQGDRIDLRGIDADTNTGGNEAFHFVSAFTGNGGEALLVHNPARTITTLLLDTDGDKIANHRVAINGYVTGDSVLTGGEPVGVGGWLL